jgi:hypothetical protein
MTRPLLLALSAFSFSALAQSWPTQTVRVMVGFPPGCDALACSPACVHLRARAHRFSARDAPSMTFNAPADTKISHATLAHAACALLT